MMRLRFMMAFCWLMSLLSACGPQIISENSMSESMSSNSEAPADIVSLASRDSRLSTLVSALKAANLQTTLQSKGPFTVFAPTNEAFAQLGSEALDELLADQERLADILLYHVVNGIEVDAEKASQLSEAKMANGDSVMISLVNGRLKINESTVIIKDIKASNGIVHVIDAVLLPPSEDSEMPAAQESSPTAPSDIASLASSDSRFSTLVAALTATDLLPTLRGSGPFTVFAPTNEAFAKLGQATIEKLLADKAQLSNILLYHLVSGKELDAQKASMLQQLEMANGGKAQFSSVMGKLLINDSTLIVKDIKASNGIIHVIDTVLTPPAPAPKSQDIVSIAKANGNFKTLTSALSSAGLDTVLAGPGRFTVFAPTDAAFAKLGSAAIQALLADKARLSNLLHYHILSGFVLDQSTASQLKGATMANHLPVSFRFQNGVWYINHSQVIIRDIEASNGIIHVIDTVLQP